MTAARDRSGLAVAEIGAAGLLITSFSLPWFAVTYLNSAGVANGAGVTSISWADYRDYGQTLTNLLIPLGPWQRLQPLLSDLRCRGVAR